MAHDVFISYAAEDAQVAGEVCRALEGSGIKCWMAPRDVSYGADYEEAIVDAIAESPLLVLVLSSHSNASQHVKREIQNACAEGSRTEVIPLRIDAVSYGKALRYYLGSAQWLDASAPPLEAHLRRLVEHVRMRLGRGSISKGTGDGGGVREASDRGSVKGTGDGRKPFSKVWPAAGAGALLLVAIVVGLVGRQLQPEVHDINFTQLREIAQAGVARSVRVSGEVVTVTQADGRVVRGVVTNAVAQHELVSAFEKGNVPVEYETPPPVALITVLTYLLPVAALVIFALVGWRAYASVGGRKPPAHDADKPSSDAHT